MIGRIGTRLALGACALSFIILSANPVIAGGFWRRGRVRETQLASPQPVPADTTPTPMLGSFYPTPYMSVRGNAPTGGGYSPLSIYGDQTLAMYGPMSPLRPVTAPVLTYQRGYDGALYPNVATSVSYPFLPPASRVIYPTQANYYYGFRETGTPPWWTTGTSWVDQN